MDGSTLHASLTERTEAFLAELTELSAKHGIAIGGDARLYLMRRTDYDDRYQVYAQSALTRG
jgi:hypothetical protein